MSYTIIVSYKEKKATAIEVSTIDEARDAAADQVRLSMDGFSEDREALARYGYLDAEEKAMDMPEDGGTILLADGTKIEVINDDVS